MGGGKDGGDADADLDYGCVVEVGEGLHVGGVDEWEYGGKGVGGGCGDDVLGGEGLWALVGLVGDGPLVGAGGDLQVFYSEGDFFLAYGVG